MNLDRLLMLVANQIRIVLTHTQGRPQKRAQDDDNPILEPKTVFPKFGHRSKCPLIHQDKDKPNH